MKIKLFTFFVFISWSCFSQSQEVILNSNWKFRRVGDSVWLPATIPGTVHTDLLANKIIPDPYFGTNEKLVQWVDTADWEYECAFEYHKAEATNNVSLLFEGLDTYAEVYLNDSPILTANNMFRSWQVSCEPHLKEGTNYLKIKFLSAVKKGQEEAKHLPYQLPGEEKAFTRKAAYHYGWDWGPRFVTCGIWKPVKLVLLQGPLRIINHHVTQENVSAREAILNINTSIENKGSENLKISIYDNATNQLIGSNSLNVLPTDTLLKTRATIQNPKLWWCNGLGEPTLYTLRIEISSDLTPSKNISYQRIGIRTIELIQEKDSVGRSFYFKLNGKPVFIKGANIIPPDNFLPRVTAQQYKNMVNTAHGSNMNMLRVWGGGVYADQAFYDACDEQGILVWQDFMFANTMYPGNEQFLTNVRAEVEEQIIRLRNHASLALWCGNNEISEGWFNWGWQKQFKYSSSDSLKIWTDYQNLFESTIPDLVKKFDPSHSYWPSSPQHGWGRKKSLAEGDSHYWGVWWGLEPFSKYQEKVGRFMSEYGFQGMPSSYLFKKISNEKTIDLQSEIVKYHQKHPKGFQTIDHYLTQYYQKPKSFEDYCYVSQLVQAEGMKTAIEAHRSRQPYCMGTLFWQLNDCWPVTSWSSIDYFGSPKAAHYLIKKAYQNEILSTIIEDGVYKIFSVADSTRYNQAKLSISVIDFNGNIKWQDKKNILTYKQGSAVIYSIDSIELSGKINPSCSFLLAELHTNAGSLVAENIFYFTPPKNLCLQKPTIQIKASKRKNSFIISTDKLAKNVYIDATEEITFSENYFDLLPGKLKEIEIVGKETYHQAKKKIKIRSLYDTY